MATEKHIKGAVSIGNKTYRAGDEAALDAAIAAGEAEGADTVDVERLSAAGVLVGYGKATAESAHTINRQRKADGTRADEDAVDAADEAETAATEATPAPKAAAKKSARKKK